MPSPNDDLQAVLRQWASQWEALHRRLAQLAAEAGDARAKAQLVQFTADLEVMTKLPQQLGGAPAPGASSSTHSAPWSDRPPAIVLVEDEPDLLIIMHRLFRDLTEGYDLVPVISAEDALVHISLREVPLVMTDYKLDGMNGLQLTAAIKETSPDTKVILTTAYATPELEAKARKQRVDYYLPKPYPLDKLEQIVRHILR